MVFEKGTSLLAIFFEQSQFFNQSRESGVDVGGRGPIALFDRPFPL